jgi:hypothetical protein
MIQALKKYLQIKTNFRGSRRWPADIAELFLGLYKRGYCDIHNNSKSNLQPGGWYIIRKSLLFSVPVTGNIPLPWKGYY